MRTVEPIAIIGIGCRLPGGVGAPTISGSYWLGASTPSSKSLKNAGICRRCITRILSSQGE